MKMPLTVFCGLLIPFDPTQPITTEVEESCLSNLATLEEHWKILNRHYTSVFFFSHVQGYQLRSDPTCSHVYEIRASVYRQQGNLQKALNEINQAMQLARVYQTDILRTRAEVTCDWLPESSLMHTATFGVEDVRKCHWRLSATPSNWPQWSNKLGRVEYGYEAPSKPTEMFLYYETKIAFKLAFKLSYLDGNRSIQPTTEQLK